MCIEPKAENLADVYMFQNISVAVDLLLSSLEHIKLRGALALTLNKRSSAAILTLQH